MTAILKSSKYSRSYLAKPSVADGGSKVAAFTPPIRSRREKIQATQSPMLISPLHRKTSKPTVHFLNPSKGIPAWLQLFVSLQRTSTILAFLMVSAVLATYSWTVYSQHNWSRAYGRLETLKDNERKLMQTSESLKNQIAQQAETPGSGLVLPDASHTVYLEPAPVRSPSEAQALEVAPKPVSNSPLGY